MTRRRNETIQQWLDRIEAHGERLEVSPHVVYKAFDSYGLLLYIGCTVNLTKRMGQHRAQSAWHRFAETVATWEYPSRSAARAAERAAIDTEAAYFNSAQADIQRTQANRTAAQRAMRLRAHLEPEWDFSLEDDPEWLAEHEAAQECWRRAYQREQDRLKGGAFPFMTDEDRLARYLAARADAELARLEAAA